MRHRNYNNRVTQNIMKGNANKEEQQKNGKLCIGVDIGGTTVKIGLFTTQGEMVEKWEITTRTDEGGKYILSDIAASVEDKLAEKRIEKSDVAGVGMGVPGPVKADGTVIKCVNLGWGIFNVEEELSKLLDLPVKAGMMQTWQRSVRCGRAVEKAIRIS